MGSLQRDPAFVAGQVHCVGGNCRLVDTGSCSSRHIIAECNSKQLSLHLIQWRVLLYVLSCFWAIVEATLLQTTLTVGPIPPDVEKKLGERKIHALPLWCIDHKLSSFLLILLVALTEESIPVTPHEWAEYPYIKECAILISSQEVICCDIYMCSSSLFAYLRVSCSPESG